VSQQLKLIITRGLPASGKTTKAKAWVAEDPKSRARVNRDDLRAMVHNGQWKGNDTEKTIVAARDVLIGRLLNRGISVVCDDVNLRASTVSELFTLGGKAGAELEVWDLSNISLETCILRDKERGGDLWQAVIPDYYDRFIRKHGYPLPLPDIPPRPQLYTPQVGLPLAYIVDIDGTVALKGNRSPYDESRVLEDRGNVPVIRVIESLKKQRAKLLFVSGRTDSCREMTENWLRYRGIIFDELWMRKTGDTRNDAVVKREIFDTHIRHAYYVAGVFDDRNRVVEMWRSLGLTVFQVADGDF